ncbi:MAG: hypothetical protein KatS3mg077_2211 [Candidatus Binatia bacterium]|nr:MAG: hypothetical protein KatS3mg077_2211 [Candidatus Binatia bacterium]
MPDPSRWLAPYPHPVAAVEELVARIGDVPVPCRVEPIGHSSQGRALFAFHLGGEAMAAKPCARLLVTAQIHAGEFIGGTWRVLFCARLPESTGKMPE